MCIRDCICMHTAEFLKMSFVSCDGGEKSDSQKAENIFSASRSGNVSLILLHILSSPPPPFPLHLPLLCFSFPLLCLLNCSNKYPPFPIFSFPTSPFLNFSCYHSAPVLSIDHYVSAEDHQIVTVCAKEESGDLMSITKMKIDVQCSSYGAKAGLLFLSSQDLTQEKHTEKMREYDNWTLEDYKKINRGRRWWVFFFFLVCDLLICCKSLLCYCLVWKGLN